MHSFFAIIAHDLKLAFRKSSGTLNVIAFFIIAAILFPFGIGVEEELLQEIAPGVIWACCLLAYMLAIPQIYAEDYENGTLAQMFLTQAMPESVIGARLVATWFIHGVPLILASPILAILFHIESKLISLMLSLLIGTPILTLIGSIAASLTLGVKRAGALISLLSLPLFIPVLIFGSSLSNISFLLLLLVVMLPISIFASSAAVKLALEFD